MNSCSRFRRGGAAALGLVLLVSCRSSGTESFEGVRLPYHVALAPSQAQDFVNQTPETGVAKDAVLVDLRAYTTGEASEAIDLMGLLAQELEGKVFSQATRLRSETQEASSDAALARGARAVGADLLMVVEEVVYDARPESKGKASNWLWFLTGPFELLTHDRSFKLDATIEVVLYDMNLVGEVDDGFELPADAEVRRFRAKPDWVETKFTERAEGGLDYIKSFFMPSAFLRKDGERARDAIAAASVESMARALAGDIAVDGEFLTRPNSDQGSFYLAPVPADEPVRPRLVSEGSGPDEILFVADILQRDFFADRPFGVAELSVAGKTYNLQDPSGSGALDARFDLIEGAAPGGMVRKRLSVSLPAQAAYGRSRVDDTLQLRLAAESGESGGRSWTFPLERDTVRVLEARMSTGDSVRPVEAAGAGRGK